MKSVKAIMGLMLLAPMTIWGQAYTKPRNLLVHPRALVVSGLGNWSVQAPAPASITPTAVYPLIFHGAPAGNISMTHTETCTVLALSNRNAATPTETLIFSVNFDAAPGSTYVDVEFTSNLNFFPGWNTPNTLNSLGAAIDCRVEQDLDSTGTYSTSYFCSGITATQKPWMAFDPSTDSLGSAFETVFRGYAPIVGFVTSGGNTGKPAPTRVVVKLIGIEWTAGTPDGEIDACNNNLKVMY